MNNSFNDRLIQILKKDLRFIEEETGDIIKSEIVNEALKIDKNLIELLLEDKGIKDKFFIEIKGHWVFELNKFVDYIQDKNFLSDSYTKFKNKIGLNINGKFLNERKEVSLVWPFKDCVLEGGMTKEDEKRNEIFFNEILAQDEIDRLFDPKVLTDFKRCTEKGEEKITDFKRDADGTIRENLIIKGNNLLALHSLKKQFQGKVKLIYIDPPYNTGNDGFRYNDTFNYSTWLTFIKNRLEIGRELLHNQGLIFISIDDKMYPYLRLITNEVFNPNNYLTTIIVENNPKGRVMDKNFSTSHEYLVVYSKDALLNELSVPKSESEIIKQYPEKDERGSYRSLELRNTHREFGKHNRPNLYYPIYTDIDNGSVYLEKKERCVEILPIWDDGYEGCWTWSQDLFKNKNKELYSKQVNGKWKVYRKAYATDYNGERVTKKLKTIWIDKSFHTDKGRQTLKGILGEGKFYAPKPVEYIKQIIKLVASDLEPCLILDFFAGSGTTGQAVLEVNNEQNTNHKFILIEQMDYVNSVTIKRLSKIVSKDESYIFFGLMKFNKEAIDKIQLVKSNDDLLKIWDEMVEHYFLNYEVDIKRFNDNQEEFKKLQLDKQKKILVEMLNKNQLYVNYSEINDSQFNISEEEKELNKKFYQG